MFTGEKRAFRRVAVLVVHGIGQQQRGECALELARCVAGVMGRRVDVCWLRIQESLQGDRLAQVAWCTRDGAMVQTDFFEMWWGPLACSRVGVAELARLCWGAVVPGKYWSSPGGACAQKWVLDAALLGGCVASVGIGVGALIVSVIDAIQRAGVAALLDDAARVGLVVLVITWVAVWARQLLERRWRRVALGIVLLCIGAVAICDWQHQRGGVPLVGLLVSVILTIRFVAHYLGDVVRYACAGPYSRHGRVRDRVVRMGCAMLRRLMYGGRGSEYDEVVMCAHSLGSLVAADVLTVCAQRPWWKQARHHAKVHLVTLGSPLAKFAFFALHGNAAGGHLRNLQALVERGDITCHNLWFVCDPVADRLYENDERLRHGWPVACHLAYWRSARVGEVIA